MKVVPNMLSLKCPPETGVQYCLRQVVKKSLKKSLIKNSSDKFALPIGKISDNIISQGIVDSSASKPAFRQDTGYMVDKNLP